jgi:hypothetical protein
MKKLLFILMLMILFACQKDKFCWICITTITQNVVVQVSYDGPMPVGFPNSRTEIEKVYNLYPDQIIEYTKDHTYTDSIELPIDGTLPIPWLLVTKRVMDCTEK